MTLLHDSPVYVSTSSFGFLSSSPQDNEALKIRIITEELLINLNLGVFSMDPLLVIHICVVLGVFFSLKKITFTLLKMVWG